MLRYLSAILIGALLRLTLLRGRPRGRVGRPQKRLFVGFDHRGIALEVIAIEDNDDDRLVVIHAMKLRKRIFHLLKEGAV